MDAQRLNEQLKQAGTLGYIDASTRLAASKISIPSIHLPPFLVHKERLEVVCNRVGKYSDKRVTDLIVVRNTSTLKRD